MGWVVELHQGKTRCATSDPTPMKLAGLSDGQYAKLRSGVDHDEAELRVE
jgi:hypothetical protein